MPGPCNPKKQKKIQLKKEKRRVSQEYQRQSEPSRVLSPIDIPSPLSPRPPGLAKIRYALDFDGDASLPKEPCIMDPGNGPRVKDIRAFLASSFATPPALDDPMCAEFAQSEVLDMLHTVLPEDMAQILWYNKSRQSGRICPACQRLYNLGDALPEHLDEAGRYAVDARSSRLQREQEISGLCSPLCFIAASYNYPEAIRSTWGRLAEELNDQTWEFLNGPGGGYDDMGLGMLLRMTRLHDLALAQLCFPGEDLDSDASSEEVEIEKYHMHEMDIVCMTLP